MRSPCMRLVSFYIRTLPQERGPCHQPDVTSVGRAVASAAVDSHQSTHRIPPAAGPSVSLLAVSHGLRCAWEIHGASMAFRSWLLRGLPALGASAAATLGACSSFASAAPAFHTARCEQVCLHAERLISCIANAEEKVFIGLCISSLLRFVGVAILLVRLSTVALSRSALPRLVLINKYCRQRKASSASYASS
jgi:hypothetical protein